MGFNLAFGKKPRMLNANALVEEEPASMPFKEEMAEFLQRLEIEEANLIEKRQNLISLREKLQSKLQKEIESKELVNKKLRGEIADLRIKCEKLSLSIRASRNLQNLERASKETFRQTMINKGYSEKAIERYGNGMISQRKKAKQVFKNNRKIDRKS